MVVEKAVETASKAVSNDIAVLRTRFDIESGKGRKKRLTPVEAELHVNPMSIAVGAATALLGALAATVAWQGISIPVPFGAPIKVVDGMKDTGFGKDISSWYLKQKLRRQGADAVESQTNLTAEEIQRVLEQQIGGTACQLLNREHVKAKRAGRTEDAVEFLRQAKEANCPWAQ